MKKIIELPVYCMDWGKKSKSCKVILSLFSKAHILICFFLTTAIVQAQTPELIFKHINLEQGLSNSTIETIFQDSYGFMWFGTRDGLNRYDGYEMTVYANNSRDTNSISDNYIRCIYEDKDRNLWIGTDNGLNRFNRKTNIFTRFKHQPGNNQSLSSNIITCITQDTNGNLWIGTYGGGGLNLLSKKNVFFLYRHIAGNRISLSDDRVSCLFRDTRDRLWVGTSNGLNLYDQKRNAFIPFFNNQANGNKITTIASDNMGKLWIGTEDNGVSIFDPLDQTFRLIKHQIGVPGSLGSNQVKSILCERKGNIWIGTINGGLNLFRPNDNLFYHYQDNPDDPESLSQRTVSALFEDKQGNLWIGTHRGGINLYSSNTHKFKIYRQELNLNSLSYNDVKSFCEDKEGNIWIGTDGGGLNLFNKGKKLFVHYRSNNFDNQSLGSDAVLDIMQDSNGNLWIATWGGGLNLRKPGHHSFKQFMNDPANPQSISSNFVQKTYEDHDGKLWVATYYGGLNYFNSVTGKFTRFIGDSTTSTYLSGNNIISLIEDAKLNLWMGTDDGGLNCYDKKSHLITHYFDNEEKKPDIRVLFKDSKGRFWVGQKGLYLFNETKRKFFIYTDKAGLSTEFIKGITEDEHGTLWISTSNGLTQFNPENRMFKKYNTGDGLQGMEFEANACLKTKNGEMYFGGLNGFNSFYPGQITINKFIPPVYITDFQIFNKRVKIGDAGSPLQTDIALTKEIHLSYNQSTFSFNFSALNYKTSENNQYAYKLEGFDKEWNYAGKERRASYTNLSPGKYIFYVKGSNNDGVWNEQGSSIIIIITPPFWDTWWFKTLIVFSIIAVVIVFVQFRRKLELKKLEESKKEEMHQVQLQFFTNISHEFRTPLSLILGPLEKLLQENPQSAANHYYKVIYRNANRLMNLINELMDFRKSESGALKLNVMPGNLGVFLNEISEEFSELAIQKNMMFEVRIPERIKEIWFDRQILEKIVINLISNSFKYTSDGGAITVETLENLTDFEPSFENELVLRNDYHGKKYIFLRVADNGIGISKESIRHLFERYYKITDSHLGSGIGLAFVKSLTFLHKGAIYVYSEKNKGTEIIIGIPVSSEDYNKNERWIKDQKEGGVRLESIQHKYEPYHPSMDDSQSPSVPAGTSPITLHILLVDDNEELRKFIKDSLEPDYYITEASDGVSGFTKAKEEFPDLIISDVLMPIMNGIEFCKAVKEDIEISHIPFIMLTAKSALESRIEGAESGADFYFAKPLSLQILKLTIRNIFSHKQKLKEKYFKDYHVEAKELVHSVKDKEFMDQLIDVIESQITNPDMNIDYICTKIGMSRTKLYQKIKSITGQSTGEFIRSIRLKKAVQIMTHEDVTLTEVMYSVGIQTQSYFTKAFKKEIGKTPSQFLKDLHK
jgi:ligand-binding sensor domain-containing protein/signal transduction histidine kinase/DNA-binding response OmpR family regulator